MNLLIEITGDNEIYSFNTSNVLVYTEEEMLPGQNAIKVTLIGGIDFWMDKSEYRVMKEAIEGRSTILEINRDEHTFNRY